MNLKQCGVTLTIGCVGSVIYVFNNRNFRERAIYMAHPNTLLN